MPVKAPAFYEVRCPHCHALQFLARAPWEFVAIDEAAIAIMCWRRTCKHVLGLRVMKGTMDKMVGHGRNGRARTAPELEAAL